MSIIFLLGLGLLPIWLAMLFIIFSFMSMESNTAAMTFWAIVPAVFACAVTIPLAGAASAVHSKSSGDKNRKLLMSGGFLTISFAILALVAFAFFSNSETTKNNIEKEKLEVEQFVETNPLVIAKVGIPKGVSVASYGIDSSVGPMPKSYDVGVNVAKSDATNIYAIVEVDRDKNTKQVKFRLVCLTPLSMGDRSREKCKY